MKNNIQPYGYLSLYADAIHNFIDGVLIGATWMFMPELGVVTTISIVLHEIPQEISDLGILIHSGFTRAKALLFNFLSALTAVIGTVLALWIGHKVEHFSAYILPLAAGGFVYLAASSLLPEVIKDTTKRNLWLRLFFVLLGLFLIYYFSLESGGYTHRHSH
jgi:zinc and cadmium transporter